MRHFHVFPAGCLGVTPFYSLRCSFVVQRSFSFWLSPQRARGVLLCGIRSNVVAPGWCEHGIGEEDRSSMGNGCSARAATGLASSSSPNQFCWQHLISSTSPERAFSSWCFDFGTCWGRGELTGDRWPHKRLGVTVSSCGLAFCLKYTHQMSYLFIPTVCGWCTPVSGCPSHEFACLLRVSTKQWVWVFLDWEPYIKPQCYFSILSNCFLLWGLMALKHVAPGQWKPLGFTGKRKLCAISTWML